MVAKKEGNAMNMDGLSVTKYFVLILIVGVPALYAAEPARGASENPEFLSAAVTSPNTSDELAGAILNGDFARLVELMEKEPDINVRDSNGGTPLITAAFAGQAGMVNFLLNRGAKVNDEDLSGRTPLLAAILGRQGNVQGEHRDVVAELLRHHANVNATSYLSTPLQTAVHLSEDPEIVRLLVEDERTDLGALGKRTKTPLQIAEYNVSTMPARYRKRAAAEKILAILQDALKKRGKAA
jgi:ankyrin repeat protein